MNRDDLVAPDHEFNPSGRHFASYPKVFAIGHPGIPELFVGPVLVEEKADGSQFSFQYTEHYGLRMRSKGADVHENEKHNMFGAAVDACQELRDQLHPGWVYRAEYLRTPRHNTLAYDRVPKHNLILFDISIGDNTFLTRAEKETEAARLGLEIVPVIYEGELTHKSQLEALLDREARIVQTQLLKLLLDRFADLRALH